MLTNKELCEQIVALVEQYQGGKMHDYSMLLAVANVALQSNVFDYLEEENPYDQS